MTSFILSFLLVTTPIQNNTTTTSQQAKTQTKQQTTTSKQQAPSTTKKTPSQTTKTTQQTQPTTSSNNLEAVAATSDKSVMVIEIAQRTKDLISIFNLLKKQISTSKISIELTSGKTITNVVSMSASESSTVILFKITSNVGYQQLAVFTEDIKGISTF